MENHLLDIAWSNSQGEVLLKLGARLTLRLVDKVDADLTFEFGSVSSNLDRTEVFYFLREACRENLEELMSAEKHVYFLVDEVTLCFDSELYENRNALKLLTAAINAVLVAAKPR